MEFPDHTHFFLIKWPIIIYTWLLRILGVEVGVLSAAHTGHLVTRAIPHLIRAHRWRHHLLIVTWKKQIHKQAPRKECETENYFSYF